MSTVNKKLPHHDPDTAEWKGYTMDELRYARAYTAARIELNKGRLMSRFSQMRKADMQPVMSKGLIGKVIGAFSYIDLAMLAWKIGKNVFKVSRLMRGRR